MLLGKPFAMSAIEAGPGPYRSSGETGRSRTGAGGKAAVIRHRAPREALADRASLGHFLAEIDRLSFFGKKEPSLPESELGHRRRSRTAFFKPKEKGT